jgi:hypothetical protein
VDGFERDTRKLKGASATEELPLVHRVASLLKSFVQGVLHGRWTKPWLQQVLDEFTFRFNRRRSRHRPLLFNRPHPALADARTVHCFWHGFGYPMTQLCHPDFRPDAGLSK